MAQELVSVNTVINILDARAKWAFQQDKRVVGDQNLSGFKDLNDVPLNKLGSVYENLASNEQAYFPKKTDVVLFPNIPKTRPLSVENVRSKIDLLQDQLKGRRNDTSCNLSDVEDHIEAVKKIIQKQKSEIKHRVFEVTNDVNDKENLRKEEEEKRNRAIEEEKKEKEERRKAEEERKVNEKKRAEEGRAEEERKANDRRAEEERRAEEARKANDRMRAEAQEREAEGNDKKRKAVEKENLEEILTNNTPLSGSARKCARYENSVWIKFGLAEPFEISQVQSSDRLNNLRQKISEVHPNINFSSFLQEDDRISPKQEPKISLEECWVEQGGKYWIYLK